MKVMISVIVAIFSFSTLASSQCGLSFWDNEIEKINESYARGEINHQTYFAQTRKVQKMIGLNTYECIFEGKTSDLTKEAIQYAKSQIPADKAFQIDNAKKLLEFELKHGSVPGAVQAKMKLEEVTEKFTTIETRINSL